MIRAALYRERDVLLRPHLTVVLQRNLVERGDELRKLDDGVDAFLGPRAVAGLALRDGLDEHLARAADVYLSEARLRHDGDVGLDAVLYERARADGIGLFIGEEGH